MDRKDVLRQLLFLKIVIFKDFFKKLLEELFNCLRNSRRKLWIFERNVKGIFREITIKNPKIFVFNMPKKWIENISEAILKTLPEDLSKKLSKKFPRLHLKLLRKIQRSLSVNVFTISRELLGGSLNLRAVTSSTTLSDTTLTMRASSVHLSWCGCINQYTTRPLRG